MLWQVFAALGGGYRREFVAEKRKIQTASFPGARQLVPSGMDATDGAGDRADPVESMAGSNMASEEDAEAVEAQIVHVIGSWHKFGQLTEEDGKFIDNLPPSMLQGVLTQQHAKLGPRAATTENLVPHESLFSHVRLLPVPCSCSESVESWALWDEQVAEAGSKLASARQAKAQAWTTTVALYALLYSEEPVARAFQKAVPEMRLGASDMTRAVALRTGRLRLLTAQMHDLEHHLNQYCEAVSDKGQRIAFKLLPVESPCKQVVVTARGFPADYHVTEVFEVIKSLHHGEVWSSSLKQKADWEELGGRGPAMEVDLLQFVGRRLRDLKAGGVHSVATPGALGAASDTITFQYSITLREAQKSPARFELPAQGGGCPQVVYLSGEGISACNRCDSSGHTEHKCPRREPSRLLLRVAGPATRRHVAPAAPVDPSASATADADSGWEPARRQKPSRAKSKQPVHHRGLSQARRPGQQQGQRSQELRPPQRIQRQHHALQHQQQRQRSRQQEQQQQEQQQQRSSQQQHQQQQRPQRQQQPQSQQPSLATGGGSRLPTAWHLGSAEVSPPSSAGLGPTPAEAASAAKRARAAPPPPPAVTDPPQACVDNMGLGHGFANLAEAMDTTVDGSPAAAAAVSVTRGRDASGSIDLCYGQQPTDL